MRTPPPRLDQSTVGSYLVDENGELWQHVAYTGQPTASLQKVTDPSARRDGVVGCQLFEGFVRLIREDEIVAPE